jgi:hypothetical protein
VLCCVTVTVEGLDEDLVGVMEDCKVLDLDNVTVSVASLLVPCVTVTTVVDGEVAVIDDVVEE